MKIRQRLLFAALSIILAGCANHQPSARVAFPAASINGHPARLLLDTGSSSTVLFAARARKLGLKFADMSEPTPVTLNGQTFTAPVPVFHFSWWMRLALSAHKFSPDGLVGWPEIRDNILVFDSDHRTVRRVEELPPETAGWQKVKVLPNRWLLLQIPLADGQTGTMEVDTGSPFGLEMPPGEWKAWNAAHPKAKWVSHLGGVLSFGLYRVHTALANETKLGELTLTGLGVQNMPAGQGDFIQRQAPSAKAVWTIGMYALMRMDLVVDGKNGWAYLHPRTSPGPPYPAFKEPGAGKYPKTPALGNWSVADNVRWTPDSLFVVSANNKWIKQDSGGALADYSHALEINSNNAEAYSRRGVVRETQGDFSGAVSDYDKVIALQPGGSVWERLYRQTLLWRLGRTPEDFSQTLAEWKEGWTKMLGLFLAGKMDEKALLLAAEKYDGEPVPEQKSLALYYIGMTHLSHGDTAGARALLEKYRAIGWKGDDEYQFAEAELTRLKGKG